MKTLVGPEIDPEGLRTVERIMKTALTVVNEMLVASETGSAVRNFRWVWDEKREVGHFEADEIP